LTSVVHSLTHTRSSFQLSRSLATPTNPPKPKSSFRRTPQTIKMRFAVATVALAGAALADYPGAEYPSEYPVETSTELPTEYPTVYPTSSVAYSTDAYTTSTVYTTKVYTVTECPSYVTDCPAHSTYEVTSTEAVYTTVCPVESEYPTATEYPTETSTPCETETDTYVPTYPASSPCPTETDVYAPTYPPSCPTYSVKTISTSCTTVIPTVIYETVEIPCATYAPVPSAYPTQGYNTTKPYPVVTAGAANVAFSGLFAAVAGLAALALA